MKLIIKPELINGCEKFDTNYQNVNIVTIMWQIMVLEIPVAFKCTTKHKNNFPVGTLTLRHSQPNIVMYS